MDKNKLASLAGMLTLLGLSGCASLNAPDPSGPAPADPAQTAQGTAEAAGAPEVAQPAAQKTPNPPPPEARWANPCPIRADRAGPCPAKVSATEVAASLPDFEPMVPRTTGQTTLIWPRLRRGFALSGGDTGRALVQDHIRWHLGHPDYLERVTARAEPFLHFVLEAVEARDMPTELALLPIVESAYLPFAYSSSQAAGIWQFTPATGRHYGLRQDWWYDGRRDIYAATRAALDYLEHLHQLFDGDWLLAVAAYNGGEGTVRRAMERNRRLGRPTDFWHLDLPRETSLYVPRLLAVRAIVATPARYGLHLSPVPDAPKLGAVALDSQIDLGLAAELAGMALEDLYLLNPGFNRWATAPDGPHRLLLPRERVPRFRRRLAKVPDGERVSWERHRIRSGETLSSIAAANGTTVRALMQSNELADAHIRAGDDLIVPAGDTGLAAYAPRSQQPAQAWSRGDSDGHRHKVVHVVEPGDTFWAVARRYQVSVNRLTRWNRDGPMDLLRPGDRLVIWLAQGRRSGPPAQRIQTIEYSVRHGDSLYSIARRFQVAVDDIQRWNQIPDEDLLYPGQALELRVDVAEMAEG